MARRVREKEEVLNNIFDIELYAIQLYDRIAELEMQLKESERREQSMIERMSKILNENESSTVRRMAIERGMECFGNDSPVGDSSFEKWRNSITYEWNIPDYISKHELYELCDDELRTAYDNRVQEEVKDDDNNNE